ncbi:MAG: FadR/GntR family transcriptional regulator [Solirubrobacteraceae bacterium]
MNSPGTASADPASADPASVDPASARKDLTSTSLASIFSPIRSQTAFEEAVDRIGTAIRLGLLPPGSRLPAERDLCAQLGIARSTLRQALVALGHSGHLRALRGRGGGTFVADRLPAAPPLAAGELDNWHALCDQRLAVETGIAVLACTRITQSVLNTLRDLLDAMDETLEDFDRFLALDVRFHVGIAQATGNSALIARATEMRGAATRLITLIAHPPEVLSSSNAQHRRILSAISRGDEASAAREVAEHLHGTEYVLGGLLPSR